MNQEEINYNQDRINRAMLVLLKRMEWSGSKMYGAGDFVSVCPVCKGEEPKNDWETWNGHLPDCELLELIYVLEQAGDD